ncbi:MAG: M28 family peptidase [Bacteroidota bacterium]|nr:M28 family peptidase [Bacteroidota bacterium]
MTKKLFLILLLLPFFLVKGQDSVLVNFSSDIRIDELREHVKILASQKFEGRDTGKEGQKLAAQYIKEQFIQMDLMGPSPHGDPYYQEFSLLRSGSQALKLITNHDTLTTDSNLSVTGSLCDLDAEYDLVFVGYGIDHDKYSDYEDINVEGKIVAFIAGEPKDKKGKYLISESYLPEYTGRGKAKATYALKKGAIASIRINPEHDQHSKRIQRLRKFRGGNQLGFPDQKSDKNRISGLIHIGINDASLIFDIRQSAFEKAIVKLKQGKIQSGVFNSKIQLVSNQGASMVETENVVAFLPGTELSDEYVIITAHYDHLGKRDDKHAENSDYVYVYISDTAGSKMSLAANSAARYVQENLRPEYRYLGDRDYRMGGSDHASFEKVNVPVLYFFCGIHNDYHRPSDTWDKIEYEKFTAITRMVFISAWQIANQ